MNIIIIKNVKPVATVSELVHQLACNSLEFTMQETLSYLKFIIATVPQISDHMTYEMLRLAVYDEINKILSF